MDYTTPISLNTLLPDDQAMILSFKIGRSESTRLVSLGFTPGATVNMTQNYGRGPLIVTVRGTRVALGRGEATKIFVKRISE